MSRLKMIPSKYFKEYNEKQKLTLDKHFGKVKPKMANFNFYFVESAVYSSMIEGNEIDVSSYMRYSMSGMNNKGKSFLQIEELKASYEFAKENRLTLANFLKAHKIATKTLLKEDKKYSGAIRDKNVMIFDNKHRLIFTGAEPSIVKSELEVFFDDISTLLSRELSLSQVFYYASMIHLIFVQIHPFADGNGRCSRLLEKWFIAEKIGKNAWFIQSEKLYQKRIKSYWKNVNIGADYKVINYDYSIPFLLMLPMSLRIK